MKSCFTKFILIISCSLILSELSAQKNHSIYFEGLGNAFLAATINYDLRFGADESGPGARIGVDIGGSGAIPVLVNYLAGGSKHKIELGAGVTIFTTQVDHAGVRAEGARLTGVVGYRYHADSGFLARAGWTPIATDDGSSVAWFGASIGWRF